jgi:hypothetical protein
MLHQRRLPYLLVSNLGQTIGLRRALLVSALMLFPSW